MVHLLWLWANPYIINGYIMSKRRCTKKGEGQEYTYNLIWTTATHICLLSDCHCLYIAVYVGMAQGILFSLYIGIGAKFQNTQKTYGHDNGDYWAETQQSFHWKGRTFWSVDLLHLLQKLACATQLNNRRMWIDDQPTVQVGCLLSVVDVQGFYIILASSSSFLPLQLFWLPPSPPGVVGPGVDCNAILSVILPHCLLVYTQSLLKGSACFSNVKTLTIFAWNFINDS